MFLWNKIIIMKFMSYLPCQRTLYLPYHHLSRPYCLEYYNVLKRYQIYFLSNKDMTECFYYETFTSFISKPFSYHVVYVTKKFIDETSLLIFHFLWSMSLKINFSLFFPNIYYKFDAYNFFRRERASEWKQNCQ